MQDFISTETSQTAMACEQAALFGAIPGPDEFDNREIWNEEETLAGIEEAIHILAGAVAPDGTQLADERESLLWGFVNTLHAQVQRLDRGIDKIAPEMKDLQREQDGSEIKSRELERLTDRVQNLGDRRDAFETMRDLAAEGYRTETGDTCTGRTAARPANSPRPPSTPATTCAPVNTRDLRASARRHPGPPAARTSATLPPSGARWTASRSSTRTSCCTAATRCGEDRGKLGREEPPPGRLQTELGPGLPAQRRLLNFLPKGLVAFPGSGITNNMIDKARKIGIPVLLAAV